MTNEARMTAAGVTTLVLLCAGLAGAEQNDWIIVPGKRLGPIVAGTSRTDLTRLFGTNNVEDKPVDTGEGPEPATVIFEKDVSAALALVWRDNRIDRILVCYKSRSGPCKWHTSTGITLGTTIARLEALNGRAFTTEPWGSDVGGNVTSWQGGKLAGELGDGGNFHLLLTLDWQQSPNGREIDKQRRALSSDPAVRALRPVVSRMLLIFPGQRAL